MRNFENYQRAEAELIFRIIHSPNFITNTMHERIGENFCLTDILKNQNTRSNYSYAEDFFQWLLSGEKILSNEVIRHNEWVKRFVSTVGLPDSFSASYGWKIKEQLDIILEEIDQRDNSRRGYVSVLIPNDQIILTTKTTHEYPCTIGFHLMKRDGKLHMVVNMRSNNCLSVMPYDVYNFTRLQQHLAHQLHLPYGNYYHMINSAHLYNGDVRRIKENDGGTNTIIY